MQNTEHNIWAKSKQLVKLSALSTAFLLAFNSNAFAAKVPAGVVLAEKQEIALDGTEPETLDPQKMSGSPEGTIARQLFEGLITHDAEGNIQPGVATSWEHSPDYKIWTFKLRPNAKWSNGDPVTAHDFVYAWRRLADPKTGSPYSDYLEIFKMENATAVIKGEKPTDALGVKALDDHTLQLTLSQSLPYAVELTGHYIMFPTHQKTVETFGDKWTLPENLVGNGAYSLAERVVNEKVVFKRNPTYWNNDETVLNQITMVMTSSDNAGINRFRAGELDMTIVPPVLFKKIKDEFPNQLYINRKLSNVTYEMNIEAKSLADVRVRKALDLAVDRSIITEKITGRGETPTFTFTPKYIFGGEKIKDPEYANWTQAEREAEARKLLKEAGYSKENPLKFEILYTKSEMLTNLGVAFGSMWKKVFNGAVEVTLKQQEWKTYLNSRRERKFEMAFASWGADYNEATTYLTYFLTGGNFNRVGFSNKEYDDLVNASYTAPSNEARQELYAKAEALLDAHHPFISLYNPVGVFVKKSNLKGYDGKDPQSNYLYKDWYLEKP
ncbi:oligopeptide ABC transporter substrate-binding protein OppA [Pasteurellaceae bacterium Orientalotternb1]|nr:oligopeptide ABC transporter substrate-binding protein OppA [Pasteurellaceae bacterium Orientalotternb1]